ncbi:AGE family epimerase/isomerase [Mameliella alba]|nr:AGE family epimerase/isomerase [Mameliella alba]MBY6172000.1 AGE family epimerase/isomerase [Mameliella alba]MBY6177157.1 AGE family epimerase/isomerase [Mameliella alba]
MTTNLGTADANARWLNDPQHRAWLAQHARSQFDFFGACLRAAPGFHLLDFDGTPIPGAPQELHSTTRMVHSYALGQIAGVTGADKIVDHGMSYIWSHHRDTQHGGYVYALNDDGISDPVKLAYGHVFVLLAGASAKMAGHPDADRMIADATEVLNARFWDDARGLFADEFNRDWTPFSTYRGMNANMHGVEALLTAYEATGEAEYLSRAGRILDFFIGQMAPDHHWRLPEHYTEDWKVDPDYEGNPMFRPAGTTPGHSFEFARLLLQHWDLNGRPEDGGPDRARKLFRTALKDSTDAKRGGFVYTVDFDGGWMRQARYWWPVTEAIGAVAAFLKLDWTAEDEALYRELWTFADRHLIDHAKGGWFPELDEANRPEATRFTGKPDIYHSIQGTLFPMVDPLSRIAPKLAGLLA